MNTQHETVVQTVKREVKERSTGSQEIYGNYVRENLIADVSQEV